VPSLAGGRPGRKPRPRAEAPDGALNPGAPRPFLRSNVVSPKRPRVLHALDWFSPAATRKDASALRCALFTVAVSAVAVAGAVEPFFALRHYRVNHNPAAAWVTLAVWAIALVLPFAIRLGLPARIAVHVITSRV